jgi:hypothetical protein
VVNLALAVVWLGVSAAIFAQLWLNPEAPPLVIPGTQLSLTHPSLGWFSLCLCLYNLVRWWAMRRLAGDRVSMGALARRRRRSSRPEPREDQASRADERTAGEKSP